MQEPERKGIGHSVKMPNAPAVNFKKKQEEARKDVAKKRLNEFSWPKEWSRSQKRRCVAACKRAIKKGYAPQSPQWKAELAKAGFTDKEKDLDF